MPRLLCAVLVALLAFTAPSEAAKRPPKVYWQVNATAPARFAEQLGFIPVRSIRPSGWFRVKAGGGAYSVRWDNTVSNARTAAIAANVFRFDKEAGLFLDRRLTPAEQRRVDVLADVARDADVLVLHASNPACAGLTSAQARAVAAGEIADWSQVGSSAGRVSLHLTGRGFPYGLFGVEQLPPGATLSEDGGVGAALQDRGAASVVSYSAVRDLPPEAACMVPLDGVAPAEESVRSLTYPGAYPVSFAMSKERSRRALDRLKVRRYVAFLRSGAARRAFAGAGVVLPPR